MLFFNLSTIAYISLFLIVSFSQSVYFSFPFPFHPMMLCVLEIESSCLAWNFPSCHSLIIIT